MSPTEKTRKIIRTSILIFLTVLLSVFLISSPLFSTVDGLKNPDNIANIASNINIDDLLVSNGEISEAVENVGLTEKSVEKLMKTEAVKRVLILYSVDFINAVKGNDTESNLTREKISEIAGEHLAEISAIIRQTVPNSSSLSDTELNDKIITTAKNYSKRIISALPSLEQIKEISNQPQFESAISVIKGEYLTSLILLIIFLGLIILISGIKKFESFLYLGFGFLISAFFILVSVLTSTAETFIEDILIFLPQGSIFNAPLTDFITEKLVLGFVITAIIGGVFTGGYYLIKNLKVESKKI